MKASGEAAGVGHAVGGVVQAPYAALNALPPHGLADPSS